MAIGQRGFHRYLKQQRAMGRTEPTREDKAAYLQGDIQARLALSNQQRRTGLQERAQQAQESQFAQSQRQARKQWQADFGLREDEMKRQERWNKLRGISEIAKLGFEAAPYLKSAGQWAYGKMGGYEPEYEVPEYDRGYDVGGGDYGYEPSYEVPQYDTQYDIQGGDYGMGGYTPPPPVDYSQFDFNSDAGWFDF